MTARGWLVLLVAARARPSTLLVAARDCSWLLVTARGWLVAARDRSRLARAARARPSTLLVTARGWLMLFVAARD